MKYAVRRILAFDKNVRPGSREHYFHFLIGYLLPSLDIALRGRHRHHNVFASCGPLMDTRIHEACEAFGIDYSIGNVDEMDHRTDESGAEWWRVPRWDGWLWHATWPRWIYRPWRFWPGSVPSRIRRIRTLMIHKFSSDCQNQYRHLDDEYWLLLRRSPQHVYYGPGGGAEIPTYGVGRRSIVNIDAVADVLIGRGYKVKIYEPGAHDLAHQIKTFRGAAGIIGIRGAEFANVLWMRPGTRAIMLTTPDQDRTPTAILAHILGIRFAPDPVGSIHPVISDSDLDRILALR